MGAAVVAQDGAIPAAELGAVDPGRDAKAAVDQAEFVAAGQDDIAVRPVEGKSAAVVGNTACTIAPADAAQAYAGMVGAGTIAHGAPTAFVQFPVAGGAVAQDKGVQRRRHQGLFARWGEDHLSVARVEAAPGDVEVSPDTQASIVEQERATRLQEVACHGQLTAVQ